MFDKNENKKYLGALIGVALGAGMAYYLKKKQELANQKTNYDDPEELHELMSYSDKFLDESETKTDKKEEVINLDDEDTKIVTSETDLNDGQKFLLDNGLITQEEYDELKSKNFNDPFLKGQVEHSKLLGEESNDGLPNIEGIAEDPETKTGALTFISNTGNTTVVNVKGIVNDILNNVVENVTNSEIEKRRSRREARQEARQKRLAKRKELKEECQKISKKG